MMKLTKILIAMLLLNFYGCASTNKVPKSYNPHFVDSPVFAKFQDDYRVLQKDFTFYIGPKNQENGQQPSITVPAGFVTDLASIPFPVNLILNEPDRYAKAAIIHDYMYWVQPCGKNGKKIADKIFKQALKNSKNNKVKAWFMKAAVSFVPDFAIWNRNREKRRKGETRFIPKKYWSKITSNKWEATKKSKSFIDKFNLDQREEEKIIRKDKMNDLPICCIFEKFNDCPPISKR